MIQEWAAGQLARLEASKCSQTALARVFLWCGIRIFRYVVTWNPPEKGGELRAMSFASSERDHNEFVRGKVDELDESYKRKDSIS